MDYYGKVTHKLLIVDCDDVYIYFCLGVHTNHNRKKNNHQPTFSHFWIQMSKGR